MANSRLCLIPDCGNALHARGWCRAHYLRWYRHGDPLAGGTFIGSPMKFVEEVAMHYHGAECLLWPFSKDGHGYGHVTANGKIELAHRYICKRVHGDPPTPKHEAAHNCGKGYLGCVTQDHLEWKTSADNEADKLIHGTHNRGDRHGMAKLTQEQAVLILNSRGTVKQSDLAKELGVTRQAISDIMRRKTWAWLVTS